MVLATCVSADPLCSAVWRPENQATQDGRSGADHASNQKTNFCACHMDGQALHCPTLDSSAGVVALRCHGELVATRTWHGHGRRRGGSMNSAVW